MSQYMYEFTPGQCRQYLVAKFVLEAMLLREQPRLTFAQSRVNRAYGANRSFLF